MKIRLGSLLLLICIPAFAQIYQWTNKDGVTVYSDKPHPGAKTLNVGTPQTFNLPKQQSALKKTEVEAGIKKNPAKDYQSLSCPALKNYITVRNNNSLAWDISCVLTPNLQTDDKAILVVDNQKMAQTVSGPSQAIQFSLLGVDRGEHQLQVQVLNAKNVRVISTPKYTVYFQQNAVQLLKNPGNDS